jgi:3-carboxy-cis,cis-muconate cycloisomerase
LAEIAASFAILTGTCGKIARDVALLMQPEVAEAAEPSLPGRGGPSTLPHKRDPVGASIALSAAAIAPNLIATILAAQVQEQERAVGGWQAEWMTFPALALVASGALQTIVTIAVGLEIDVERVRANLELSGGQIMGEAVSFALAEKIGRPDAQLLIQELSTRASQEKKPLKELVLADARVKAHFTAVEIEKLFIPLTYQGSAQTFIDRLVMTCQRGSRRPEPNRQSEVKLSVAPQLQSITEIGVAVADLAKYAPRTPADPQPDASAAPSAEPPAQTVHVADSDRDATGARPDPHDQSAPPEDESPLMDVLSRADAEAAETKSKRKSS